MERFGQRAPAAVIAAELRVSERSVRRWRRAWRLARGRLASRGRPRAAFWMRRSWLSWRGAGGRAAGRWVTDQRWTLARVRDLVARRFGGRHGAGIWYLLRRGLAAQMARAAPSSGRRRHRGLKTQTWPDKRRRRLSAGGSSSRTSPPVAEAAAVQDLARRGSPRSSASAAAGAARLGRRLACYRPGDRPAIWRLHLYRGARRDKAFTWSEYRDLLMRAPPAARRSSSWSG